MRTRTLALAGLLAGLAIVLDRVAGPPDAGSAMRLLSGSTVTSATEAAFVGLLCWLFVAGLLVVSLAASVRELALLTAATRRRRALALLGGSLLLLGLGLAKHQPAYHVCCSNAATVQQVQTRVH